MPVAAREASIYMTNPSVWTLWLFSRSGEQRGRDDHEDFLPFVSRILEPEFEVVKTGRVPQGGRPLY